MVMNNGDRMTCQIKGLDAGVLYVTFDYIDGTASVDWSKVARLESKQLFIVKTQDGSVYTGALTTAETAGGRPVKIQVVEAPEKGVTIDQSQVIEMVQTSEKFWQRLSGEISWGITYSKGNQSTQYNLGSQTAYLRERWSTQANFSSSLASSSGTNASARNSLGLSTRHLLPWNDWFYSGPELPQSSVQESITKLFQYGAILKIQTEPPSLSAVALPGKTQAISSPSSWAPKHCRCHDLGRGKPSGLTSGI
jgi:hypothetical protein